MIFSLSLTILFFFLCYYFWEIFINLYSSPPTEFFIFCHHSVNFQEIFFVFMNVPFYLSLFSHDCSIFSCLWEFHACFLKSSSPCVTHQVVFSCLASVPSVMIKAFLRSLVTLGSWTSFKSEARRGRMEVVIISVETDNCVLRCRVVWLYSWVGKTTIPESLTLSLGLVRFHREDSQSPVWKERGWLPEGKEP